MSITRRLAAAAAGLLLSGAASASLITNGMFDASLADWTPSGFGCSTQVDWQNLGGAHGGVARLNACGEAFSDPKITQTIVAGLAIGQSYVLTWEDLVHASVSPNGQSFAALLDGNVISSSENLSGSWQSYSVSFVATSNSHSIGFAAERLYSDVSYYVDNVALNAVPEPTSLTIAGLALAALALSRRRRK